MLKFHILTASYRHLIKVVQSNFRVVNCKELQLIVQLSKLSINSVEDVEWLPTCYQIEPIVTKSDTEIDDDQVSIISISSESSQGSVTSMSLISISEVEPFVSSDSKNTVVESDLDSVEFTSDDSDKTDTASESEMDLMPNNAAEIIDNFYQYNALPEVLNNIILYPQSGQNFRFLNQLVPSVCIWTHPCECRYPSEQENIVEFYFRNHICPKLWPKYLMYYQPTMWVENASASLLHFLMRTWS